MSSQSCVICGPKRTSRALCNCCQQYLCRDHLKEHDDLLNSQLEPLADSINELAGRIQEINLVSLLEPVRVQLEEWRQFAHLSVDRIFEEKSRELDEFVGKQFANLNEQIVQLREKINQLIREQDATNEQIDLITMAIRSIDQQADKLQLRQTALNIRPLVIDANLIQLYEKRDSNNRDLLTLSSPIRTISQPRNSLDCAASNETHILLHCSPTLCLYDHSLNIVKQTPSCADKNIADICWSSTLGRFLVLTDESLFSLDETQMMLEQCKIPPRDKGHWHNITCSATDLLLTAFKWGTYVCVYSLRSPSLKLIRRWQPPMTGTHDESIDHLVYYKPDRIALIIQNRVNNEKHFQLRSDQTFHCLLSFRIDHNSISSTHRHRFCSILQNEWLLIDSNQSQLLHISSDGQFKQSIEYQSPQPLRALQLKLNSLLVISKHSVNIHEFIQDSTR